MTRLFGVGERNTSHLWIPAFAGMTVDAVVRTQNSCPPETVGLRMGDCGIVRNTNMYEQFAKEFHVALREISKQLIPGVLILPPAVTISLGVLLCVLVALLGVPLTESLPDFIGAVAGPVAFMQIYFLLAAGFVIYLCFVVYQNWAGMKMPPIAIRLFFKILKSAGVLDITGTWPH